jgi:hypothetical protein
MRLKKYIKNLQRIADQYGNLDLYTSADDEGNGFRRLRFAPEIRLLLTDEDVEMPEDLVPTQEDEQTREEWLDSNGLDEEYIKDAKPVVLL